MQINIEIDERAQKEIDDLLKNEAERSFFRISVLGGGCSGFQYNFSFEIMPNEDDIIFNESGIDYLIDKVSIDFIKGSTLEYISELSGSYFQIVNPNATANCGCGTSFSI